ncbi:Barrierpepsin [Dactylellina cionopaga]|nr:Barrierpepsin [Dactylellina cionopaga]
MRFTKALTTASICLATAEGLKFNMYSSLSQPLETARDLAKRASTISTTFKFAAPQFSYYVDILVGSTHEFIRLRLSSDPFTWFPGPLPKKNYCNGATDANFALCVQANFSSTFDPAKSTTFKNLTSTLNLTSSDPRYFVLGYYGQDTIQIGQTEVDNVPIGIATDYSRTPQLGMGIGGSGSTQKTLLRTMLDENVINVLAYGLYLNDYDTNSSELTIGAIDTAKYDGNLITFESSGTTTVQLNTFEYDAGTGGTPETLARSWNANVEFSTGLLYFPNGPLQAIVGDVNAYLDTTYGGYLTDCSYRFGNKSLIFNFEGMTINVPASQWIVPAYTVSGYQTTLRGGNTPACIVLVDSMDNYGLAAQLGYVAVFGMPFVRATYLVHDFTNQQTSFAQAKLNTTDSELKSLGTDGVAPFATMVPSTSLDPTQIAPTGTETGIVTGGPGANGGPTNGASNNTDNGGGGSKTPIGAIVGGVVGGIAVICIAIGAFIFFRRRQKPTEEAPPPQPPMDQTQQPQPQPYGGAGYNNQGYDQGYNNYNQGGYNEQYSLAPNLPNKGYAQPVSPGPHGAYPGPPMSPMSEMAATPMDPSRHSSVVSPMDPSRNPSVVSPLDPSRHPSFASHPGMSELPSPKEQTMPVELPGHQ